MTTPNHPSTRSNRRNDPISDKICDQPAFAQLEDEKKVVLIDSFSTMITNREMKCAIKIAGEILAEAATKSKSAALGLCKSKHVLLEKMCQKCTQYEYQFGPKNGDVSGN